MYSASARQCLLMTCAELTLPLQGCSLLRRTCYGQMQGISQTPLNTLSPCESLCRQPRFSCVGQLHCIHSPLISDPDRAVSGAAGKGTKGPRGSADSKGGKASPYVARGRRKTPAQRKATQKFK